MVDGDRTGIVPSDLPPVDGLALCAAHEGRSHLLLRWLDPSLTDEHDVLSVNAALDMYDPANFHADGANPVAYSAEFLRRFTGAQRARRDRVEARVLERLVELRSTPGAPREQGLHRLPHACRPALPLTSRSTPTTALAALWGDARRVNYAANAMGRVTSLTAFLSQWSSLARPAGRRTWREPPGAVAAAHVHR